MGKKKLKLSPYRKLQHEIFDLKESITYLRNELEHKREIIQILEKRNPDKTIEVLEYLARGVGNALQGLTHAQTNYIRMKRGGF